MWEKPMVTFSSQLPEKMIEEFVVEQIKWVVELQRGYSLPGFNGVFNLNEDGGRHHSFG